jgi:acyl carrier protein
MVALPAVSTEDIETRIRILVADQLGVDVHELAHDVSLIDDLAADSLDLAEIALAISGSLGVVLPGRLLDRIRTCGELVEATVAGMAARRECAEPWDPRIMVRVRITDAGAHEGWYLERALGLSPYAVETIAEDARHAGPGARVQLSLPASAEAEAIDWLDQRVAPLRRHGIEVDVRPARVTTALLARGA